MIPSPSITPPFAAALPSPTRIVGDLPPDRDITPNERLLIISRDQSWLTHGFHKYPAKFFPELPRWAINKYSRQGELVLDPMAGSGTVNVESLLAGRPSIAVDVDPFARLLARVKTTALDPALVDRAHQAILDALNAFDAGGESERSSALAVVPEFPYRDTWFRPFILEELGAIRAALLRIPAALGGRKSAAATAETAKYVDFFRICLSSIIREVSNADNNCTRTVVRTRLNKRIVPGMALRLFRRVAQVNVERMRQFVQVRETLHLADVGVQIPSNGDARQLPVEDSVVDLAVTSPPYINAVDYPRTHQLEMYLLDLSPAGVPLAEAKRQHIGTEVVRASDYGELHLYGHKPLDSQIEWLYGVDKRRAYIVYRYFADMEQNFREVHRTLKPGAHYVVVVGNNLIRGRLMPTYQYLMATAERVGLGIETFFASEVIRHYIKVPRKERIAEDWVLVFNKR